MKDEKQIQTMDSGIVMPAISPKGFIEAWKEYQSLKKELTEESDVQLIQGKEFLKKSYWRKIATAFNLSVEITDEKTETIGENNLVYHFTQKATAPNGRFAYGTGSCDRMEKGKINTIHNTRGTAETRAFNRAVSNLVGGGEVSAEEVSAEENTNLYQETPKKISKPLQENVSEAYEYSTLQEKAWCKNHPKSYLGRDQHGRWYKQCVLGRRLNEPCEIIIENTE